MYNILCTTSKDILHTSPFTYIVCLLLYGYAYADYLREQKAVAARSLDVNASNNKYADIDV